MAEPLRHLALLCGALFVHSILSESNSWGQQGDQYSYKLSVVNLYKKALQLYQDLIHRADRDNTGCANNHTQRYEVLNQSIAYHWQTCLRTVPSYNMHMLQVCMEDRAHGDLEILVSDIIDIRNCTNEKESHPQPIPSEAEWAKQVAEVKNNLTAVKKNAEFYVALENKKLANKTNCYNEFSPLVDEYAASIELVVSNCLKFVPFGRVEEFKECCESLLQPTFSDVQSKLMYVTTCGT